MSLDNLSGKIWLNGNFIEWDQAKVHVLTHSLNYASSVFEGERAYKGKIFKLPEHTDRLFHSAEIYQLSIPFTKQEINKACEDCLKINNLSEAYVRPLIWLGPESMKIGGENNSVNIMIAAWCPDSYKVLSTKKKINIHISDMIKASSNMVPATAKASGNYAILTMIKRKAYKKGFEDAVMLDIHGNITEATGSNIFFVKDSKLFTPIADCFLNGITRQTILEIARRNNMLCEEVRISPENIGEFEECFLTGTAAEILPVASITNLEGDKTTFNSSAITDKMLNLYYKEVGAI